MWRADTIQRKQWKQTSLLAWLVALDAGLNFPYDHFDPFRTGRRFTSKGEESNWLSTQRQRLPQTLTVEEIEVRWQQFKASSD